MSGRKKSRVSLNLRALRRATRFTPPLPTKVSTPAVVVVVVPTAVVVVTLAPSHSLVVHVQEATPDAEVDAPTTSTSPIVAPS